MGDRWGVYGDTVMSPATRQLAIVPSDTADLADIPKSLVIRGGGDVKVIMRDDPADATGEVWPNMAPMSLLPGRVRRVLATGTSPGANILALY